MRYRQRHLEAKVLRYKGAFPAVLVTGGRQVGKSTLLWHLFGDQMPHVVFDPVVDVDNARKDPEFFIDQHPAPIILDEIQYAPELLGVIKRRIDRSGRPGQYFLTGSQDLAMLRAVSESLAGRVIVLDLGPMTLAERSDAAGDLQRPWLEDVLDGADCLGGLKRRKRLTARRPDRTLFEQLWRGGYPGILDLPNEMIPDIFQSYLRTYVERDVRRIGDVRDQHLFTRFLGLCAALTAQEINHSQIGRELGVTPQTANRWLATLRATFQWIQMQPYHGSTVKRISGRAKGYISDTGLACHLQRISSPQALAGHPLLGALFETHVVLDMSRQFCLLGAPPQVYHWRSHGGAEVDLLLERDGVFHPIEIKCKARVTPDDARGIKAFRKTYPHLKHGPGLIVAAVEEPARLRDGVLVVPYDLL